MTRILVIESELRSRTALRRMLEGEGFEVDVASDGEDGIQRLRSRPADLVIADLDDVAERREAYTGVKFIAVPGNGRGGCTETAETARQLGAQGFLPKPFGRDALLATVRATLGAAPPIPRHA